MTDFSLLADACILLSDYGSNTGDPQGDLLAEVVADAEMELRRLRKQQAELVSALRGMVDMFERHISNEPGPDDAAQRWDAARDAIAHAVGDY